ncbi:hypothetical protein TIFTF001_044701 [Ficus carica]|uniref:Uncharacterized protein n=1 Tax=Ficus carica TaxID=3494 RepID=A0AA87ZH17_FICCA|nr:hypothetical protein TIFTF001_044701 [Ficus carica]
MDSEAILSIPLGISNCLDNLIWHYDSWGLYTVRSGYWVAMEAKGLEGSSNVAVCKAWWGKLWSLKLLSKGGLGFFCPLAQVEMFMAVSFAGLCLELSEKGSREELEIYTSMAWAIWRAWNMWVHSNHIIDAWDVMEMAGRMLGDFLQCFRLEVPVIEITETDAMRLASERSKWSGLYPCYLSA